MIFEMKSETLKANRENDQRKTAKKKNKYKKEKQCA